MTRCIRDKYELFLYVAGVCCVLETHKKWTGHTKYPRQMNEMEKSNEVRDYALIAQLLTK